MRLLITVEKRTDKVWDTSFIDMQDLRMLAENWLQSSTVDK